MIVTIKLEFDRESLWQWDLKQRLILTGVEEGVEVHFSSPFVRHNEALRRPTYIEDGVMYANIPDSLLQKSGYIRAFIYTSTNTELGEAHTIDSINFKVKERKKPQNYICEEEEILLYNALMERVKNLENKEVDINEETFVVIIRQTGSGDYKSYRMNKTFEELQKAFNDGKALLCRYLNTTYVLWSYYDDQKEFVFINISENNKTSLGLVHINSEKIYINSTLLSSVYYTKEDKYYTPTQEYHLTPKKYVDEALSKINFNVLEEADIIPFGEYIVNSVYTPVEINGEIKMPIVGETYTMLAKNMSIDSIAYGKEIVVETVAKSNGKGVLLLFKNIPYDFYSSNIVFDFYNNHCTLSTSRGTYLIKLTGKTEAKIITEKSLKDYLPTQENWYICDEIDAQGRPVISEPKEDMYYLVQLTQTVENEVEYDVWSFSSNKWVLVDRLTMTYEEDNKNNNNNEYELQQATENQLGGIKAKNKTDNDTVEVKIGEDGKLYVPTYPEQNEIPVDSALDKTSTNPVQNKAVAEAVDRLSEDIVDYSSHKSNTTMHVTSAEKQVWNGKANKTDIPTIVQEAGESETSVMSQKATTDLIKSMIPETDETEYETVDSVSEMTDTSKQYVLSTTGTIWTYGEVTENVNVNDQIFDASKAFTGHMSGVNITSSSNKLYPLSIDISQIPQDVEAYVEIDGFYERNATSPYMEKVGFSALENPKQGNSQILKSFYVNTEYLDLVSTTKGCRIKVGYGIDVDNTTVVKIDGYETIKTMLLEIPPGQTHDASTIKVYLQYSYSGTVTKWYDTELEPSTTGGGGGNTIELLVKINQNTTDIYEMGQRVTALETGSDTLTIPSFWQSAVDECIAKIKALQVGRNCITVPFFSDNHQRNGYAGLLIAYIMKECNIPYCFYGGDSISNGTIANETEMIAQDKAFDTIMSYIPNGRLCRAVGNHDGYWYDGTNKYYYDRPQVYELFLREESIAQNKHFGGDGTYYYVDDLASKTRFVVMNTNGGSVDSAQLSWVQNTALSFNESGWGVVFISHQPISNHYHAGISNAKDVASAISTTATSKNVPIMGWYSGHVHRDILSTKVHTGGNGSNVGTENGDLGFTQVIITSDHTGISYDDATKHTVANDDKSHAIDFATFNKSTRTVNITRLGIGSDRSYTY